MMEWGISLMKIDLTQTHDVIGTYHSLNYQDIREEYQDPATKYAFDVLDEKYTTGYLMKLACFRHLQDLKRIENEDFPIGLNYDIIKKISQAKNEPSWLLEWRLKSFDYWLKMKEPNWAHLKYPKIDYQSIYYFGRPKKDESNNNYPELEIRYVLLVIETKFHYI